MRKLLLFVLVVCMFCTFSIGVYATDSYSGNGESTILAHVDSR